MRIDGGDLFAIFLDFALLFLEVRLVLEVFGIKLGNGEGFGGGSGWGIGGGGGGGEGSFGEEGAGGSAGEDGGERHGREVVWLFVQWRL